MKEKVSVPFMLLGILFNVCLIAANLLETKVIQVGSITVTAGLLVFPISYIINDCIAEVWGFKKARLIIWSGLCHELLCSSPRTDRRGIAGGPFLGMANSILILYSAWPPVS